MTTPKPSTPYATLAELGDTASEKLGTLLSQVSTSSEARLSIARALLKPMLGRELSVPEGAQCTECESTSLKRIGAPAWGPWGGTVECLDCGHKESLVSHIGRSCVSVEPLEPST